MGAFPDDNGPDNEPRAAPSRGDERTPSEQDAPRLGESDANELLSQLAQVAHTSETLVDGLRAAAQEATNRRVARALMRLSQEVARGRELSAALGDASLPMPVHVRGLVAAASRTGQLGVALDDLVEHHRSLRASFWTIWGSLIYPLAVLLIAASVLCLMMVWIVPIFADMFRDFDLRLPTVTISLLDASSAFRWIIGGPAKYPLILMVLLFLALAILASNGRGGSWLQRLIASTPIIGPLWTWSGTAGFMHLLATLLDYQVPLPEALRLTADGMKNAEFRRVGCWLADRVAKGESLSDLVDSSGCLPYSAAPILRWGERSGVLAEAARTVSDLFVDRVRLRTAWLRSISPPVIYLFVVTSIGFAIVSLFAPLVTLIQGLV